MVADKDKDARSIFAILHFFIGLVVPTIYATNITSFSFASTSIFQVAYWLGLPAASYMVLAYSSIKQRGDEFQVSETSMMYGAIASYLSYIVPATFIWYISGPFYVYSGGGANIGLGLFISAQPLYLPLLMFIGFSLGKRAHGLQKRP